MSEVNKSDTRIIKQAEDVIDAYCCSGENSMAGAEVELCFFNPATPGLNIMTPQQNKTVMDKVVKQYGGSAFNNEPASDLLEANSIPAKYEDLHTVFDDIQTKTQALTKESANLGLKRSYFQDLPDKTAVDLLGSIVDIERYQAFFNPPRTDMMDIAAYFTLAKSTQVSISYKNYDHMHANVRRLYLLAPFLFMLTDNSSGFNEGKPFPGHHGMFHRSALKSRGGFPRYIFSAQNGEEYIEAHIKHVMNNPMYVFYDDNGILQKLPSGTWWTFERELKERDLNTAANYYLSQSILWPDVKIASLKDENGDVTHHRYEARMFGVGLHQAQTAMIITAGLSYCENFAGEVDNLLRKQGLCIKNAEGCIHRLTKSYEAAQNHNGKFFDILYGDGWMFDFAQDFAIIMENSTLMDKFDKEIEPALHILKTGWSDSKTNRVLYPDLNAAMQHQINYDSSIFENPNTCAHMLYGDKIST